MKSFACDYQNVHEISHQEIIYEISEAALNV